MKYYAKDKLLCYIYETLEDLIFEGYGMESEILEMESDDYRDVIYTDYIEVPELNIRIHEGVCQVWCDHEQDYMNDYCFFMLKDIDTGEVLYTEGYSSMYSCLHNYFRDIDYENLKCNVVRGEK